MTRHGDTVLDRTECTLSQNIIILCRLIKILEDIHSMGLAHNDLKTDQVAVGLADTEMGVDVTLLDLGMMTPFGTGPYTHHPKLKPAA